MKWPWRRTETRAGGYTDAIVNAIIARASGSTAAVAGATAALETAASHVGRAFAAADVAGRPFSRDVLTPAALMLVGRELIRNGELLLAIDADLRVLLPATSWDVQGSPDPMTWEYRATMASPSYTTTRTMPAASVIHPRYAIEPARPWAGLGPVQVASLAGKLSASVAASLAEEAGTTTGFLLPLPVDGDDPTVTGLKADLRSAGGGLHLVESVRSMHAGSAGSAPARDWAPQRLGPNPPAAEVALFTAASNEVLSACGVPVGMVGASAEGTSQRESYRRFLHATIGPLARLVQDELRDKLDDPDLVLSFDSLFAGGPGRPGAGVPESRGRGHGPRQGRGAGGAHGVGTHDASARSSSGVDVDERVRSDPLSPAGHRHASETAGRRPRGPDDRVVTDEDAQRIREHYRDRLASLDD